MEREIVSKYVKIFGAVGMLVVSLMDIIAFIVLTLIPVEVYGGSEALYIVQMFNIYDLLALVLWLCLIVSLCTYLITGIILITFSNNNEVNDYTYSKHLFLIGVVLLLIGFLNSEFIYLIYVNTNIVTYVIPYFILIFFITTNCYVLIVAIVMGGVGLYWVLDKEGELKD
ncbi:MAG: hypothetical protein EU541_01865 [Promethearchaeota archaeon]|nr:MAG: hypothetical protein EU541_01865 [Candidatus Lokiarchaeota archaeon]